MPQIEPQDRNGFSTVMWGFKKEEVLEYIDRLTEENAKIAQQHQENASALEAKIQKLEQENTDILSKTKQICDKALQQKQEIEKAEKVMEDMELQLENAQTMAQDFKVRFLETEQKLVELRADNSKLEQQLEQKRKEQQQFQGQQEQLKQALQQAQIKAQEIVQQAKEQAIALKEQSEKQCQEMMHRAKTESEALKMRISAELEMLQEEIKKQEIKELKKKQAQSFADEVQQAPSTKDDALKTGKKRTQQIKKSAAQMYHTVNGLKEQIADLNSKISSCMEELHDCTELLSEQLTQAEREIQRLVVQANHFPTPIPTRGHTGFSKTSSQLHNGLQTAKNNVSEILLDTVNRMLENRTFH